MLRISPPFSLFDSYYLNFTFTVVKLIQILHSYFKNQVNNSFKYLTTV